MEVTIADARQCGCGDGYVKLYAIGALVLDIGEHCGEFCLFTFPGLVYNLSNEVKRVSTVGFG